MQAFRKSGTNAQPVGWLRFAGAIIALLGAFATPQEARAQRVQLELVLAVDVSLSVSTKEYNLQIYGLAEAFRHETVIQAIRSIGDNGIAVSLIQWSDNNQQTVADSLGRFSMRVPYWTSESDESNLIFAHGDYVLSVSSSNESVVWHAAVTESNVRREQDVWVGLDVNL